MKNTFFAASLSVFLLAAPAFAHDHGDGNAEAVKHYEAPEPKTQEEAFTVFETADKEIQTLGKKATLTDNDLERIHELSYALENSVETLRLNAKTPEQTAAVDALAEHVEEVHEASEEHETKDVKKHLAGLQAAYDKAKSLLSGK